jgi:hypothetical protein
MQSDASDDRDSAATFGARLDVDVAYRDVGKEREKDAQALNTRFNLCAQGLAMDSVYACFAGAKNRSSMRARSYFYTDIKFRYQ